MLGIFLLTAFIILFLTLIIYIIFNSKLPDPANVSINCQSDNDCSAPSKCNLTTHTCADATAKDYLAALQNSTKLVLAELTSTKNDIATYQTQVQTKDSIQDMAQLSVNIDKFINSYVTPGCTNTCGFYTAVNQLDINGDPEKIWDVASSINMFYPQITMMYVIFDTIKGNLANEPNDMSNMIISIMNHKSQLSSYASDMHSYAVGLYSHYIS